MAGSGSWVRRISSNPASWGLQATAPRRVADFTDNVRARQVPRSVRDYCKGHMRGAKNLAPGAAEEPCGLLAPRFPAFLRVLVG